MPNPTGSVFEGAFLSPEASLGTLPGSPIYYVLQSLTMQLQANKPIDDVEAAGFTTPVGVTGQKEWTDVDFSAALTFNDILYILSSLICLPDVIQDSTHSTVYYWAFRPKGNNPDVFQTYTGVEGQAAGASGASGLFANSLDFSFDEKTADMKGKGIGQAIDFTVSEPGSPTIVPLLPVSPDGTNFYFATTYGGLGAGQLDECYGAKLTIPDRQSTVMTLDNRVSTFSGTVQKKMKPTAQLVVDKVEKSATYMTQLRAKGKGYGRIECNGPQIGSTGINYRIAFTFPCLFKKPTIADKNDILAATFDMGLIYDSSFLGGTWIDIEVTTDLAPTVAGINTQAGPLGTGTIATAASASAADAAATED